MLCDIIVEDDRWQEVALESLAETAAQAVLRHLDLAPEGHLISLLACDDARITALNADFRDKPQPTNVLSWPAQELAPIDPGEVPARPQPDIFDDVTELGDIAISWDTCAREAAAAQKPMSDHVTHLVIHGVLHLLGYDHIRDKDATLMENIETQILGKMGISDPYKEGHGD